MMTAPTQLERRAAQRFDFNLPVSIRCNGEVFRGCTQNISGRGMAMLCDRELAQGSRIELTFSMPADITLAEAMRVRCNGLVLRTTPAVDGSRFGVAVCLESYEYLNEAADVSSCHDFERISSLHNRRETEPVRVTPRAS